MKLRFGFGQETEMMKKEHLPTKKCAVCQKLMSWRKKWAKVWDEVKYCSERCRRLRSFNREFGRPKNLKLEA